MRKLLMMSLLGLVLLTGCGKDIPGTVKTIKLPSSEVLLGREIKTMEEFVAISMQKVGVGKYSEIIKNLKWSKEGNLSKDKYIVTAAYKGAKARIVARVEGDYVWVDDISEMTIEYNGKSYDLTMWLY